MDYEITVKGLVQGVGFRPFVYRLATSMGLSGDVRNSGGIVRIRLKDVSEDVLKRFIAGLRAEKPRGSSIASIETK
nr:acylphosphatase [Lachnospiraceae bacterium]